MGLTKTSLFTSSQNEMAKLAKALSHPARVAIIEHLVERNACVNGDLVQELGLAQATISQHLKELKELGLIQGTIEGVSVNYCIHTENWEIVRKQFAAFFNSFSHNNCNC